MKTKGLPITFVSFLLAAASLSTVFGRPFKNTEGVVIEAEIKAVSGDSVTIIRSSDKLEFPIPITSLSAEDQEYVKTWAAKAATMASSSGSEGSTPPLEDSNVKPGRMTLKFPELVVDRNGKPAQIGINIPSSYDPAKPVPLFIFMGGGNGSNGASTQDVVDGNRFVTAGMPFPKGMNNSGQANMVGDFRKIWSEYHEPMLKKLFETIPNIDKRLCILGGFSNGAHCIGGVLDDVGTKGYPEYFNCYLVADGGGLGKLRGGKDNYFFVTWGETSPAKAATQSAGRKAGGESETFEMPGTGHAFAPSGKAKAKEWLDSVVIPATLGNN